MPCWCSAVLVQCRVSLVAMGCLCGAHPRVDVLASSLACVFCNDASDTAQEMIHAGSVGDPAREKLLQPY